MLGGWVGDCAVVYSLYTKCQKTLGGCLFTYFVSNTTWIVDIDVCLPFAFIVHVTVFVFIICCCYVFLYFGAYGTGSEASWAARGHRTIGLTCDPTAIVSHQRLEMCTQLTRKCIFGGDSWDHRLFCAVFSAFLYDHNVFYHFVLSCVLPFSGSWAATTKLNKYLHTHTHIFQMKSNGPNETKWNQVKSSEPRDIMWNQVGSKGEIKWIKWNQTMKWNRVKPREIKRNQTQSGEVTWNQVNSSEIKWRKMKTNNITWHQVKSDANQVTSIESKWNQMRYNAITWFFKIIVTSWNLISTHTKPNEIKWNQVNPSEIKWNQVKAIDIMWNQVKSNDIKRNQLKSHEAKWNQANSIDIKWHQVRSHATKSNQVR